MRSFKTTTYACYLGSVSQAALINLTPVLFAVLRREYGLSYGALGFLVLTNFVTQVGADVAFSKAVDRHGFRPFVLAAGALSLVGLGVFAAAPLLFPAHPLTGFFAGTVIFSGAGGLLELLLSPIVDALPGEEKTRAMALLHSMYCWGQAGTVLVTTAALALGVDWQTIVLGWMLLPAADLLLFAGAPLNHKPAEETLPIRGLVRQRGFWLALESIVVTLAAVAPFALLHLVNRFYWLRASTVLALGMLVIMGSVVGITATLFSRRFNQMVSGLTRGLRAVADGDFSQRLEPEEGGPLQPAYEDFNKMSMELQSIQTLRADFINHFSHEFKTPITAIKGFAELLREPDTTPEERDQYLQIILDESSRLADRSRARSLSRE